MKHKLFSLAVFVTASIGLSGCGESGPRLSPVSGSIALKNGKIVKHGYLNFHPDAAKGNTSKDVAIGYIRDGQYEMKTGERSGVLPGWYKVTVDAANENDPKNPYVTEWFAEERYTDKERSKLIFQVVESPEVGRYNLTLNPHPRAKR
jgi:hypothetical protein